MIPEGNPSEKRARLGCSSAQQLRRQGAKLQANTVRRGVAWRRVGLAWRAWHGMTWHGVPCRGVGVSVGVGVGVGVVVVVGVGVAWRGVGFGVGVTRHEI